MAGIIGNHDFGVAFATGSVWLLLSNNSDTMDYNVKVEVHKFLSSSLTEMGLPDTGY
jgi:hypothetical protein